MANDNQRSDQPKRPQGERTQPERAQTERPNNQPAAPRPDGQRGEGKPVNQQANDLRGPQSGSARPNTPGQPNRPAGRPNDGAPRNDAARNDAARNDAPRTDAMRSDATRSDATRSDAARSDAARTNPPANDPARQPKTPAFAKPASPSKPGGLSDPNRALGPSRPGGGPGGPGGRPNSDEPFNQRVFDPTAEDTVVPRGRPAPSGPRPGGPRPGGQRPGGFGGNQGGPGFGNQGGPGGLNRGPNQGRPGGGFGGNQGGGGFGGNQGGGGGFGNQGGAAPDRGGPSRPAPEQRKQSGGGGGRPGGGGQKRTQRGRGSNLPAGESLAPPPLTQVTRNAQTATAVTEIIIPGSITVRDLADKMHKSPIEIIKTLMNYGMMIPITESIDFDTAALIGEELGITVNPEKAPEPEVAPEPEAPAQTLRQKIMVQEKDANLVLRPPVVVVLGHVDHGKTTLLDAIRETRVVDGEAGGITQHIGAYQIKINGRKITFLDTPGHEAFTAMRARGAQVTDIAIVVVAADDGVMPQTKEAIAHVKAAQVPIMIALNKIDKANSNPDRVKQELADNGVLIEEYGGDVMCVPVSAKMRRGIGDLLESILLLADVDPQSANPTGQGQGTVIESRLDRQRGPMATLLVQNGTLRVSDSIVSGETYAKIRAMYDDKGEPITEALPATPVQILGFSDVPVAGETFRVVADDRTARAMATERQLTKKAAAGPAPIRTLESIFAAAEAGQVKELNLILKADVQGSIEPIVNSLDKLSTDKLKVKILHQGTGNITESDVMLAIASHAIIVGFSVTAETGAQRLAEAEGVDIRIYNIIYNIIEDVQKALTGLLEPVYKEVVTGHAEIRAVFKVSKVGKIAGCMVLDGEITRNSSVRVKRGGAVLAEDKIAALKRFQEDATEVKTGFECGINLHNFHDFEAGDILETYKKERVL